MKKGYMYITLTTLIFSTMEIALKLVSNNFNPIQLTFTRFFIVDYFFFLLQLFHFIKSKNIFQKKIYYTLHF